MEYPKALYKGSHYTDWALFCRDLENRIVQSKIVTNAEDESDARAEGYTDASVLMTPEMTAALEPIIKRRGMPKGGWPKKHDNPA